MTDSQRRDIQDDIISQGIVQFTCAAGFCHLLLVLVVALNKASLLSWQPPPAASGVWRVLESPPVAVACLIAALLVGVGVCLHAGIKKNRLKQRLRQLAG